MKKLVLAISIIFFSFSSLEAQVYEEEIIVKSSKLINNQLLGASTNIITKEDINNYPGESLVQIISKLPGIEFKSLYGTGFGAYESIDIRGFADTAKSNTVILLNGHKLSNIDSGFVDFTTIPINSVQRIEVIKGNSAAVLYGGNATAGAINIITDQLPGVEDSYSLSTTTGSYGQVEGYVSGRKSFNDYSMSGNSSYAVSDGYRRNNSLRQKNGNLELNGMINEKSSFHINISAYDHYIELPGDVPVNAFSAGALNGKDGFTIDPRSTDTPMDFATKHGHKALINSSYNFKNDFELINDASYRFNKSQGFFFGNSFTDTEMDVVAYNPKLKFKAQLFGYNLSMITGLDSSYTYYRSDRMGSNGGETNQVYKFSDSNLGLYFNSETQINSSSKLGFGARFQGNWLKATDFVGPASGAFRTTNADSLSYDPQYAFHLGFEKNFNSFGTAFSRIGRSFTYPNVDQRVGQFAFNQSHDFKLRSQVSNDIELGHKFGFNKLKMSNTFYYMNLRAELYYDAVNFMNKNLDASKRYGFESLTTYNINKRIYVKNSFSTSKSKMRAGFYKGKEIPGVPDLTNTFEVNFKIRDEINFYTNLYYKGSTRMINDTKNFQVKIPEYYLLNMGVKGSFNQFKYSLAANNVLDKSYYNYAVASASTYNAYNTYPLSEFNMLLKVSMEF